MLTNAECLHFFIDVAGCCGWLLLVAVAGCCCLLWLDVVSCRGLLSTDR